MKYIRKALGPVILFCDAITRPKPMRRSQESQKDADIRAAKLALYQFHTCPFCVKVRRAIHRLNIKVELCDAKKEDVAQELIKGGGKRKVPCLRIREKDQDRWMYESKDIIRYLDQSFA